MNDHVKEIVDMVVKLKGIEESSNTASRVDKISNKMKHLHDDHGLEIFEMENSGYSDTREKCTTVLPYATIFAVWLMLR